jgi:hypothetical protein
LGDNGIALVRFLMEEHTVRGKDLSYATGRTALAWFQENVPELVGQVIACGQVLLVQVCDHPDGKGQYP